MSYPDPPIQEDTQTSHLAPLKLTDNPDRVPDTYMIWLKPGYTITQHKEFVGKEIPIDEQCEIMNLYGPEKAGYSGVLKPEALDKVRSDPGVEFVECDGYVHGPQIVNIDGTNHALTPREFERLRKNSPVVEKDKQVVGEEAMSIEEIAMMEDLYPDIHRVPSRTQSGT